MLQLSLNYNQLNLAYLERTLLFYQACSQDVLYKESVMSVRLLGPANFLYFIYLISSNCPGLEGWKPFTSAEILVAAKHCWASFSFGEVWL